MSIELNEGDRAGSHDLTPLQRAALALKEMRVRLDAHERARREPIAVVGIGCRFPGGVDGPDSFWRLLSDGVDAITEVPPARWKLDDYYDAEPAVPGKMYTRFGGFLESVDRFDAEFFGISPREAKSMDPQQRLVLEVCWEALERAGYPPSGAPQSTGVFVGVTTNDYGQRMLMSRDLADIDLYYGGGNSMHTVAGRVSYVLGFDGPAMVLDTACSSSLVAVHLAAQSLRAGECDRALAGGVNLILAPEWSVIICQSRMLASDGRCKTFDAAADGYVRGEGCGMLVLKRLSDAIADADNIVAVLNGSAVAHGGASSGLTVPNGPAQQRVIRAALAAAGISPGDVDYVEAHGTGTALGDPIEVAALAEVFGAGRRHDRPLLVGAAKTNIGHLESAAGVAGLIKTVLAVQHRTIPAHLHLREPNPHIPWNDMPIEVPTEARPWPQESADRLPIAGVSSFGVSGVNAHVVVSGAPLRVDPAPVTGRPVHLLPISARSGAALSELAQKYADCIGGEAAPALHDLCRTAATGRVHFNERAAILAASPDELKAGLEALARGTRRPNVCRGTAPGDGRRARIAFLFSGQGAQYAGMGLELYRCEPVFRDGLDRCAEILDAYFDAPLLSVLHAEPGTESAARLNDTGYTQPALFSLEYALSMLWRSWGIEPDVVLGHSVGEYAAACVAGVFGLEDGLRLIAARARLMQDLPAGGAMRAVMADVDRTRLAQAPFADCVSIAAINGPRNTVIAGAREAVTEVARQLENDGIETRELRVSHAFHSPLMEPILEEFERIAATVNFAPPRIQLIANVTGGFAGAQTLASAVYWKDHIRKPVRFAESMRLALEQRCSNFIEIGPGATLLGMAQGAARDSAGLQWLPSLREGREDPRQILGSLAELYARGVDVNWAALHAPQTGRPAAVPTYPFQRERHWMEPNDGGAVAAPNDQASGLAAYDEDAAKSLARELEADGELTSDDARALPRILQALADRRQREQAAEAINGWLFETRWEACETPDREPADAGKWLLCGAGAGLADDLAHHLETHGGRCWNLPADDSLTAREGLRRVLETMAAAGESRSQHIVFLESLEDPDGGCDPDSRTATTVMTASRERMWRWLLNLTQVLLTLSPQRVPRLWIVTRGGVAVDGADGSLPVHATLWGFAHTIAIECPEIWGGIVDLPLCGSDAEAAWLCAALGIRGEDQLALREGRTYVPRVRSWRKASRRKLTLSSEACYLISGGLGGIGMEIARDLLRRGARKLVLIGRRGAVSAAARNGVARLQAAGAEVLVEKVDVSHHAELAQVIERAEKKFGPLRGLVHAAGISDTGLVTEQSWERFARVFAPKVQGAWNLHLLTRECDLDFFLCLSSTAVFLGHDGQSGYAAANAFLDGLAHFRRARGAAASCVNFGPWGETGMASARELTQHFAARGMVRMASADALSALAQVLDDDAVHVGIFNPRWPAVLAQYPGKRLPSHLHAVSAELRPSGDRHPVPASEHSRERLFASVPAERETLLFEYTAALIARVLGHEPQTLDQDRSLLELGMDSLMAMQLRNSFLEDLGLGIALNVFLEGGSVRQIHCAALVSLEEALSEPIALQRGRAAAAIDPTEARALLGRLDELSDEEVNSLLGSMAEDPEISL